MYFRHYLGVDDRPLTAAQLQEHLRRQMRHLHNSARLFDEGDEDEAVRLGTTVRILAHHTRTSHSLLKQMGVRDTLAWVDTGTYRDEVLKRQREWIEATHGPDSGLIVASTTPGEVGLATVETLDGVARYVAPLRTVRSVRSTFSVWWEKPLIETSSGATFNRRELVLAMSNKDGGAHVDPSVPAAYDDFVVDDMGVMWTEEPGDWMRDETPPGGWKRFAGNVAAVSMRQIAFEVEATIYRATELGVSGYLTLPVPPG